MNLSSGHVHRNRWVHDTFKVPFANNGVQAFGPAISQTGFTPRDARNAFLARVHPEDREAVVEHFNSAMRGENGGAFDDTYRLSDVRDGQGERVVHSWSSRYDTAAGGGEAMLIMTQDITEVAHAQKEAAQHSLLRATLEAVSDVCVCTASHN